MAKHGGAWKVAYADFITAMMALFMVLWILGNEEDLLENFQEYFRNPPSPFDRQAGKYPVEIGEFSGNSTSGGDEAFFDRVDPEILKSIVKEFYRVLDLQGDEGDPPPVDITITSDGLRMVIFDRGDAPMFENRETELTTWGAFLLENLAWLLARYDFQIVVGSHSGTAEAGSGESGGDATWGLTLERANRVREELQHYSGGGLNFKQVSGYGASQPVGDSDRVSGRTDPRITLSLSLTEHETFKKSHTDLE